jgi:hypothetical protein
MIVMFAVERTANIKDNLLEMEINSAERVCFHSRYFIPKGCCFSLSGLSTEREKKKIISAISASPR